MVEIQQFNHAAMATYYEVRIASEEKAYAAQAADAAFSVLNQLESRLSRFRVDSDVSRLAHIAPGERMRLSEPAFACLQIAKRMQEATGSAFCATPGALKSQTALPQWDVLADEQALLCVSGRLEFDLGAIGKGFALDRMAELLDQWDCSAFLLVAGGSSVLAGDPPPGSAGWSCGLGEDNASQRFLLTRASLSGSGLAVKGAHILDPRTGQPAPRQNRAWVLADTAAESDALSTACMVLIEAEIERVFMQNHTWLAFLETDEGARAVGKRSLPMKA
jgi:thiamine biosynthesis lipoprotein